MRQLLFVAIFMVPLSCSLQAQTISAGIQANNVKAVVNSNGSVFSFNQQGQFVPIQPGVAEKTLLRGSGLWVAGFDLAGNLHGSVTLADQSDLKPGYYDRGTGEVYNYLNKIWPVSCSDIHQHLADYNDNGVIDNPNAHIYGFPAKGNPFFEQYNNNQPLPTSEYPLAGFYDPTSDAFYGPNKGEYPCIEMRGCALDNYPAQQDYFFCHDVTPHPSGLASALLDVQTQVMAFKVAGQSPLNNAIFVRYRIVSFSEEPLDSCYFGLYADFDIGNPYDDYVGTIPDQNILYGYNGDDNDAGGFGDANIPVMAVDLLRGPLDSSGHAVNLRYMLAVDQVDNLLPHQYYNLLAGHLANGAPAPNGGVMYPDDPNNPVGNSEKAKGNVPGQRVGVASYGPITLMPFADNEVIVAYYFVNKPGATPLQNVQQLYNDANAVQTLYDNCFRLPDANCDGLLPVVETTLEQGLEVYPNPAATGLTINSQESAFHRLELMDMLGRQLRLIQFDQPVAQYPLAVDDLPNGVYQLRVDRLLRTVVVQR